jgi:peroxiredoxin
MQEPRSGIYRATLKLPGGDAPFGMQIAREDGRYVLYLANGTERTRVPNVEVKEGELRAFFPGYENSLRAAIHRKKLTGSVTLIKSGGEEQVIPFEATLGAAPRFFDKVATDNADVSGRWDVAFTDDAGKTSQAVALLEQQHDRVTGTVMTPTGDHRFLEGQVHDDEVWLSTFAGGLPYLYKLKVDHSGALKGEYWQGLKSHEKLTAVRNADATLVDPESLTRMKANVERLDFTFRDIDGHPVSLSDERFRGKVVLVTLGGSWCPNCHDEAMFLAPFYRSYRDKGFEIVALMFERHGEFDKAAAATRRFRDDLGVEYTTLIAGVSDKDEASKALPTLSGVYGFPTTIFIDKQGKVRKIHTGFTGPATGHHYEEYVSEFRSFVDELLGEPAT